MELHIPTRQADYVPTAVVIPRLVLVIRMATISSEIQGTVQALNVLLFVRVPTASHSWAEYSEQRKKLMTTELFDCRTGPTPAAVGRMAIGMVAVRALNNLDSSGVSCYCSGCRREEGLR